jgi:hypothetical protein
LNAGENITWTTGSPYHDTFYVFNQQQFNNFMSYLSNASSNPSSIEGNVGSSYIADLIGTFGECNYQNCPQIDYNYSVNFTTPYSGKYYFVVLYFDYVYPSSLTTCISSALYKDSLQN